MEPIDLKNMRLAIGLTQKQIAEILRMRRDSYRDYESGRKAPIPDWLIRKIKAIDLPSGRPKE